MLALIGGVAGIFVATAGVELLKQLGPESLSRLEEANVNSVVLTFTFAMAIFTGILFGLGPALKASRRDLTHGFKEGGSSGHSRAKHRAHNTLVVAEVALSFVVLIASGLLLNRFWRLMRAPLGFDPGKCHHHRSVACCRPNMTMRQKPRIIFPGTPGTYSVCSWRRSARIHLGIAAERRR